VIVIVTKDIVCLALDVPGALLELAFDLLLLAMALHLIVVEYIADLLLHVPGSLIHLTSHGVLVAPGAQVFVLLVVSLVVPVVVPLVIAHRAFFLSVCNGPPRFIAPRIFATWARFMPQRRLRKITSERYNRLFQLLDG
jgi:hypothetical protein